MKIIEEFKRLKTRRKVLFVLMFFAGIIFITSGIIYFDFFQALFGTMFIVNCLDVLISEMNERIIKNYEEMIDLILKNRKVILKYINLLIKNENKKGLKELAIKIDDFLEADKVLEREGKNDSK